MAKRVICTETHPVLLAWAAAKLGLQAFTPQARTISHLLQHDDGRQDLLCVVVLDRWTDFTCEGSIASDQTARWASRKFINTVYDYVFLHAGKTRMNMAVSVNNSDAINMHESLGHRKDGVLRDGFGEGHDGLLYGFTKADYLASKWHQKQKQEEKIHEQRQCTTTT